MVAPIFILWATFIGFADADVKVTCPADIDVTADPGSASATVAWSQKDFAFQSDALIRGAYQFVPEFGAPMNFQRLFSEGEHYIEYRAVDIEGQSGTCSFKVNVRVIRCPVLFQPEHAFVQCDAGNYYGSTCSVKCMTGYVAIGQSTIECTKRSEWSNELARCSVATCPDPGTPLQGSRDCTSLIHAHGSRCVFACNSGHQLIGSNLITCVSGAGKSVTWSAATPRCQEIIPPHVQSCPTGPLNHIVSVPNDASDASQDFDARALSVEIHKPEVVFRLAGGKGQVAPHRCSHFANGRSDRFGIGRHVVTCTATDPSYDAGRHGASLQARCQFIVDVQVDRCRPLMRPYSSNDSLMCSAVSSESSSLDETSGDVTQCILICEAGRFLPRPTGNDPISYDYFECDRQVGVWTPTDRVPKCVAPVRPIEITLPAELLYIDTSAECTPGSSSLASSSFTKDNRLERIGNKFESAVRSSFRRYGPCEPTGAGCIVENVEVRCHVTSGSGQTSDQKFNDEHDGFTASSADAFRRRRRRRSRHHNAPMTSPMPASLSDSSSLASTSTAAESMRRRTATGRKDRKVRRTTVAAATAADISSSGGNSRLSIQFSLATRFSNGNSLWADEYHSAKTRLYAAYDYLEQLVISGNFRLESRFPELAGLHEVTDSLSQAPLRTICLPGQSFNQNIQLCVPCGPGTYYSASEDRCLSCPPGTTQPRQGQFNCV